MNAAPGGSPATRSSSSVFEHLQIYAHRNSAVLAGLLLPLLFLDYTGFRAGGSPCLAITTMVPVLRTAVIIALAVSYSGTRTGVEWITRVGYDNTGFGSHMNWPGVQLQASEDDPALRPDWLSPQSEGRSTRATRP